VKKSHHELKDASAENQVLPVDVCVYHASCYYHNKEFGNLANARMSEEAPKEIGASLMG